MKILYGVQGTGNGHISRARLIAQYLYEYQIEVQFVFSGRPKEQYYDMEIFGDYQAYPGLSFAVKNGSVNYLETLKQARPLQFFKDKRVLKASRYDLVITDFEPLTAWAAKQAEALCLGIGHQYALQEDIPTTGDNFIMAKIVEHFAPANYRLGLHWHHFNSPILPPMIVSLDNLPCVSVNPQSILIYLPFADQPRLIALLQQFPDYRFSIYSNGYPAGCYQNVDIYPPSRNGFLRSLAACSGVICNAGFELISESLALGKSLLVTPIQRQLEQLSNAVALTQLGLAQVCPDLTRSTLEQWLSSRQGIQVHYPNVAKAMVDWIIKGDLANSSQLVSRLWSQSYSPQRPGFFSREPGLRVRVDGSQQAYTMSA
ncbi:MAG: hypothetical protein K9K86_03335 [Pseudomonadales bacterium]|nr:hypothetical protein [Pseudomonadales bacterium]